MRKCTVDGINAVFHHFIEGDRAIVELDNGSIVSRPLGQLRFTDQGELGNALARFESACGSLRISKEIEDHIKWVVDDCVQAFKHMCIAIEIKVNR